MRGAILVCLLMACGGPAPNTTPPDEAAKKWLKDLGVNYTGEPNCTTVDTDNDGYVTCTIAMADGAASDKKPTGKYMSLQCAAVTPKSGCDSNGQDWKIAGGCKPTQEYMTLVPK